MSKIGRRPITLENVKVEVNGQEISYTGKNTSGVHVLPEDLTVTIENGVMQIVPKRLNRQSKIDWGLHRALLFNKISGSRQLFEKQVKIVGLGYKAIVQGATAEFSLGFSHKIQFDIPTGVTMDVDKSGQMITLKSASKELVGKVSGDMRALRPVEPYKGTGVQLTTDVIIRKAGKAKGSK